MSDESVEASSSQDDSTDTPIIVADTDIDPYKDLDDDTPHPASDLEPPEEPKAGAVEAAEETPAEPVETLETLRAERDKYYRAQQAHYEENKQLRKQVDFSSRMDALEAANAEREEDEEFEEEDPPDAAIDPVGYAAHAADRAWEAAERVERTTNETRQADERQAFVREVGERAGTMHRTFVTAHPDYDAAAEVVRDRVIIQPARALGKSDDEIKVLLGQFTEAQLLRAHRDGLNASEEIYKMAGSLGYKPAEPSNGEQPTPPTPAAAPSPVQKAAERAEAATTLAGAPGSSGHKSNSNSIKMVLEEAGRAEDPTGEVYQAAFDMVIENAKSQLPRGATGDDALEAIENGLIKTLR